MIASRLPYSGQANLELEVSWHFKIQVFKRNFLVVTAVIRIFNYICFTSSSDMHFCLEYDHKLTKQYTVHSLTTQNAGVIRLHVAEQSVTCTNSSPVVRSIVSSPLHPARRAYHPAGIFLSAGNCTSCHNPALRKKIWGSWQDAALSSFVPSLILTKW